MSTLPDTLFPYTMLFRSARPPRHRGAEPRPRRQRTASGRRGPRGVRPRDLLLLPRASAHRGPVAHRRARPDRGDRRTDGCRQDHAREPDHAVLRAERGKHTPPRDRQSPPPPPPATLPPQLVAASTLA